MTIVRGLGFLGLHHFCELPRNLGSVADQWKDVFLGSCLETFWGGGEGDRGCWAARSWQGPGRPVVCHFALHTAPNEGFPEPPPHGKAAGTAWPSLLAVACCVPCRVQLASSPGKQVGGTLLKVRQPQGKGLMGKGGGLRKRWGEGRQQT